MKKITNEMLLKLKSVFPDAVTESQSVDENGNKTGFTYTLKQEFIELLQDNFDFADDQNRYELQFPGKATARVQASLPSFKSFKTVVPDKEQSKRYTDTQNVFIEGDNLDALRMLQDVYEGAVKVIYIDPPYNTGDDGFLYNDNFSVSQMEYLKSSGVVDEYGNRIICEIQDGLRPTFHAGWLAMMFPRLKLARKFLSDDGIIFISIDDNEAANLKLICDEIFGEENFIAQLVHQRAKGGGNAKHVVKGHDYILAYAKVLSKDIEIKIDKKGKRKIIERDGVQYSVNDDVVRKVYGKYDNNADRRCFYEELSEYKNKSQIDKIESKLADGSYVLQKTDNGKHIICGLTPIADDKSKIYSILKDLPENSVIKALSEKGDKELKSIGIRGFAYPKPTELLTTLIGAASKPNSIILDFFAGSGSTADAVMQLNAKDGGKRKFILIQWAEQIDKKKSKEGYEFCNKILKRPAVISEITKERIRRAGDALNANLKDKSCEIDDGFRVYSVQDSMLTSADTTKVAETDQAALLDLKKDLSKSNFEPILYEVLINRKETLDSHVQRHELSNYPFAICNRKCYCVTKGLTQKIVLRIVEKHASDFDILYYLSDCIDINNASHAELVSAIGLKSGEKTIKKLNFY